MPFSDSYANNILNLAFAKVANLSVPSSVYIGLTSNNPEADGGVITELSGNGYSRVLISLKGENYPNVISAASSRTITNAYQINWSKATGDWATANGFFLADAATGGTVIYYGKLNAPVDVVAGSVALFDPRTFQISFPITDLDV